jgi:hypothetical protein
MLPNECCNDMFSCLNLIVKELNSLNVSNLDKGMINRKILMLLPKPKYNIINSMLQEEDLDEMEVVELVGEIRAHEMSVLSISEEATPSKSIALKAKPKKDSKLKMIKHESSSSEQDDDSLNDEYDDQELALLMRKFSRLSEKIGKKGYSFDPNKKVFLPRRDDKKAQFTPSWAIDPFTIPPPWNAARQSTPPPRRRPCSWVSLDSAPVARRLLHGALVLMSMTTSHQSCRATAHRRATTLGMTA